MKLIIAAEKDDMEGLVAARFESAPVYFLVDTETGERETVRNDLTGDDPELGLHAAQLVTRKGARGVVAGQFGPRAKKALDFAGIKTYAVRDYTVAQAVGDYNKGRLSRFEE